jgi:hypothetical protein
MSNISPSLNNVQVTVTRTPDGSGNSPDGLHNIVCDPDDITVTETNTIVNYQLVSPTPAVIVFTGLDLVDPNPKPQFSTATVSADGKMITLSDLNTITESYDVTLNFADDIKKIAFDPQIHNVPGD